ncbi:ABC transporter permease [Actinomadura sp. DC4]|uniref:ABC transporter permease n=1 Tax=Actinomadura sp. DC4 TaxID=3055069 RepID=UPI0025B0C02C|nr:ABC transporter permease [Actinomadura sp. DC4]MDN3356793.1 ABC transporter permease [Actinomadura sp. DC4]
MSETGTRAAFAHGALQAQRLLRRWWRTPMVSMQALVFPVFLLLVFRVVFGDTMAAASGGDSLNRFVPLAALVGTVFGGVGVGVSLMLERDSGLLGRFRAMPVHRTSPLTGRLGAEVVRMLVTALTFVAVGYALGFRLDDVAVLPVFALVPVLVGIGFSSLVCAIAVRARNVSALSGVSVVFLLMLFFSTGFAPLDSFPHALRPVVHLLPLSCGVDTMRGLAGAGAVLTPLLRTLAWTAVMTAVFGTVAVRGLSSPLHRDST